MRLIDADALMQTYAKFVAPSNNSDFEDEPTWNDAVSLLESAPTVDATPVKHGYWEFEYGLHYCSECKNYAELNPTLYCPNCGAKMDEIVDGYKYDFKTHDYVYVQSLVVDEHREGKYEWEEPEINPCRGCVDYDGRGGCKSNGGCGR